MACKYYVEGHLIGSEVQLNDFINERYRFKSKLGDVVFLDANAKLIASLALVDEVAEKAKAIGDLKYKRLRIYDEDGSYKYLYPYVGVNLFLKDYRDETTGARLFPTIDDINSYWYGIDGKSGRVAEWKEGNFTDDEKELFFPDGAILKIIDNEQYYIELMSSKWEALCLYGDAVHSVFEKFFTMKDGKYMGDRLADGSMTIDEFKALLSAESYENRAKLLVTFDSLMNHLKVMDTIALAKLLMLTLRTKFGKDAYFFPEFLISGKIEKGSDKTDTLLGYIDLFVIDSEGKPHIIDYKTSPKHYDNYKNVKKFTYTYLLATYGRLLGKAGFNTMDTNYLVVPIQLQGFEHEGDGKFNFTTPAFKSDIFADITVEVNTNTSINRNLGDIIYTKFIEEFSTTELNTHVLKHMEQWFPRYALFKHYEDDEIRQQIEKDGGFVKNEETNKYEWKPLGSRTLTIITADSEEELFDKVKKYKNDLPNMRRRLVGSVARGLKEAIEQGTTQGINFAKKNASEVQVNPEWFELEMQKYCNGLWKLMDSESYKTLWDLGIIVLANGSLFDFVRISTLDLKFLHRFGKNTTLMGGIGKSDLDYASKSDSLALPAINGNIELMEVMCVINLMKDIFGNNAIVGNILVFDPVHGLGLPASNEELLYNFNLLMLHSPIDGVKNNFKLDGIYLANKVYLARLKFREIMTSEAISWAKEGKFRDCYSQLDSAIIGKDRELQLDALQKLLKTLESEEVDQRKKLRNVTNNLLELADDLRSLHNAVVIAIAELKGINFRQQIEDHSRFLDSTKIWKNGVSGSYIDNPGNLRSETLNLVTKLVTLAWQNLRSGMLKPTARILNATKKLMKAMHTTDPKNLYKDLYNITDNDILFKNPWTDTSLTEAQREYLIMALEMVNKNRHGIDLSANTAEVNHIKLSYEPEYFRVPLKLGGTLFGDLKSLLEAFKEKISDLHPKEALKEAINSATTPENKADNKKTNLFELVNMFAQGDGANRLLYIEMKGIDAFESDLETILLSHNFAYLLKEVIDEVFPMIKASYIHLALQGAALNVEFTEDSKYLEEYIRNKIKNESIVSPLFRELNKLLSTIRSAASKMVLAFSPVQMFYLTILGVWNDISLVIRKPDGTNAFTMSNMIQGAKYAFKDLFHTSNEPTIGSRINELYGINDMDINVYAERLKTDLNSWNNWMMKFSSRPDYYNRMTIFNAKMINDGCYDAHSLDKDGNLVYDCKKDKRYAAFLNNPTGTSKEVLEAKALYLASAKLFELENTKMPDGTLFKVDMNNPMDLPRAYSTLESESMKDLSDTIYGYYSSEKKSLIHSTIIGSMWMQFKTYWSGKKNLYLATGGVHLQGKWNLMKNDEGKLMYYQVNDKGEVLHDLPPTDIDTGVPFYQWEGDWKEGILSTYMNLLGSVSEYGLKEGWEEFWYKDPKLQALIRSNLILFWYDLAMFAVVGTAMCAALGAWLDDLEKNAVKGDVIDGFKLAMAGIVVRSVKNSFLDFNFIDSIGDPTVSWNPFAFSYIGTLVENIWDGTLGDGKFLTSMAKTTSASRLFSPVFKAIQYNMSK